MSELPGSPGWRLVAALALALAFVLLPWWDAAARAELDRALSGVLGGPSRRSSGIPWRHLVPAVLAGIAVFRGSQDRYAIAFLTLALAGGWTACSTVQTGAAIAKRRSHDGDGRVFVGSGMTFGLLATSGSCLAIAHRRRRRALRLGSGPDDGPAWVDPDDRPRLR